MSYDPEPSTPVEPVSVITGDPIVLYNKRNIPLKQAASDLGLPAEGLRSLVNRFKIGEKINGRWMFSQAEVHRLMNGIKK